jgi:hypothetical protein
VVHLGDAGRPDGIGAYELLRPVNGNPKTSGGEEGRDLTGDDSEAGLGAGGEGVVAREEEAAPFHSFNRNGSVGLVAAATQLDKPKALSDAKRFWISLL